MGAGDGMRYPEDAIHAPAILGAADNQRYCIDSG